MTRNSLFAWIWFEIPTKRVARVYWCMDACEEYDSGWYVDCDQTSCKSLLMHARNMIRVDMWIESVVVVAWAAYAWRSRRPIADGMSRSNALLMGWVDQSQRAFENLQVAVDADAVGHCADRRRSLSCFLRMKSGWTTSRHEKFIQVDWNDDVITWPRTEQRLVW